MALALRPELLWHGRRVSLAVVDQAFLSATNLFLTILVANAVSIDAFGIYGIVWAISIFIDGFAASLINDPLPALMRRFRGSSRRRLLAAAFWSSVLLGAVSSAILFIAALILLSVAPDIAPVALALAAVNLLQRVQSVSRRLCYLEGRQAIAASVSTAAFFVSIGAALALSLVGELGVLSGIALWAIPGIFFLVAGVTLPGPRLGLVDLAWLKWYAIQSWRSGRWLLAASAAYWIDSLSMLPLAAYVAGPAGSGILRALQVLVAPVTQFNAAAILTFVPRLAELSRESAARFRRAGTLGTLAMLALALLYSALLLAFAPLILDLVYRSPEITAAAWLLWPLLLGMVADTLSQGVRATLLAVGRTRAIFAARIAGVPVFVGAALLLVPAWGIAGLVWATVASSVTIALALLLLSLYLEFRGAPARARPADLSPDPDVAV